MNSVIENYKKRATDTKEWLVQELSKIRTGRATPSFLDSVRVESYGSAMPLNQVGSVTTEDAKTIRITPWDTSLVPAIGKAVERADLGVSTSADERGVRVHFPDLTTETRERIAKSAKQKHEDARVALRNERDEARGEIQAGQKNGDYSEDEAHSLLEKIETITTETNKEFDTLYESKYQELTTV